MKTFFRILETVVRPFFIYILIMNLNFQVVNGEEKDSTFFSTVDLPAYNSEISLVERLNQTGIKYEVNSLENYSSYESNFVQSFRLYALNNSYNTFHGFDLAQIEFFWSSETTLSFMSKENSI